ncbi:cytochrome c oxidase assembly protein, partial [Kineococcus glutinatus]|uniref:cytochrome c oxidase assembly protein n=1 Tax=Kineococcus glutinatus TaxID=1070872 RepID=UPI0031EAAFAA
LALAAPVTLALRTLPPAPRRLLLRVLHSRWARLVTAPAVVLVLDLGGMALHYLTPLHAATTAHPVLGAVVTAHVAAAGYLLAAVLVEADPLPRRLRLRTRLLVLLLAAAGHGLLAKVMYAALLPAGAGSAAELRSGAVLMYYGGDVAELVLAVAVLGSWYARAGRRWRAGQRRAAARQDLRASRGGAAPRAAARTSPR